MTNSTTEAKQALAKPASLLPGILQRKCACGNHTIAGGECAECGRNNQTLQRATRNSEPETRNSDSVPAIVPDVLRASGQPIDRSTRSFFESRFGRDFSHVRLHTDARAAESASAVNALAYTVGKDVVFGANQYAPGTLAGRRLLAHELTHVVQQQGSGSPAIQRFPFGPRFGPSDDPKERQADLMAGSALGDMTLGQKAPAESPAAPEETPQGDPANPGGKLSLKTRGLAGKPVHITPPSQDVPPEVVRAVTSNAKKAEAHSGPKVGMKSAFKGVYGGTLKPGGQTGAGATELGVEIEREKKVGFGVGLGVQYGSSTVSVEGKLESIIPFADLAWPELHKRLKHLMFVKQLKFGLGVGTTLGEPEKQGLAELAGELTINAFSLSGELKKKRATLAGNLDLSAIMKTQGAPGHGANLTLGGELSAGGKITPRGSPVYVGVQLDFRLVSTYNGARWTGSFALTPMLNLGISF